MFSIIIVDDDLSDREGIRDLVDWDDLGIEVAGFAIDGQEGYDLAVKLKPDIVLTDISMPVMDGIKMTRMIKTELPQTKFVFMSCFDDFEFLQNAINLDVYGYILKPINLLELKEALDKAKRLKQMEIEREENDEALRKRLKDSMPLLQEQFTRDLLFGTIEYESDIQDRMDYLGVDARDKHYTVIFSQIDNYELSYPNITMQKRHALIYCLQQCAVETLLQEIPGLITSQQNNSLAVILLVDSINKDSALNRIIDILNKYKETVNKKLDINLTIGIGEFTDSFKKIPGIFEAAQYAVKSKFYSGGNRIILASEVKVPDFNSKYDINELKQKIRFVMEVGEEKDVVIFVENYYDGEQCYPEAYIKSLTFSITNIIQTILMEKNESFERIFGDENVVWNKLLKFETIVDIRQWMVNVLETVRKFLNKGSNNRYKKIVEDIKAVIDDKYAELENVNQIVSSLFISASHANLMFKQQTGQTIFDYLIVKRMEIAKEMLFDSHNKIYEIAEKTGYKTTAYFASVFKEYTGLTPSQYKDKYSR